MERNSKFTQVYSWSFPANHLLNLSLMKDNENKYSKYFIWLNVVPGKMTDTGSRTFDFKDGVAFKLNPLKLAELAAAMNIYARGQSKLIGRFGIFVDGSKSAVGGEKKHITLNYNAATDEKPANVVLSAKSSSMDKAVGIILEVPTALALADMLQKIFDKSFEVDFVNFKPVERVSSGDDDGESSRPARRPTNKGSEEEIDFTGGSSFGADPF